MAKPKLKKAEEVSDLNSDSEHRRKSRAFRKRKFFDSDSDESTSSSVSGIKPFPKCPTPDKHYIKRNKDSSQFTVSTPKPPVTPILDNFMTELTPTSTIHDEDFKQKICKDLSFIKFTVKNILEVLKNQSRSTTEDIVLDDSSELVQIFKKLPLDSIQEVRDFEENLDEETKKRLIHKFSRFGGTKLNLTVKTILKALMTDEVASLYSWIGGKQKEVFSNLALSGVILRSVHNNQSIQTNDKDIIDCIKNWLRHAKARSLNSKRRSSVPENEDGQKEVDVGQD